ncbi:MAG: PIN domain-containing protein [Pseudomonadota bacterium]
MIHLDTNVLAQLPLLLKTRHPVIARVSAGDAAATGAMAWYEFMNGPVQPEDVQLALRFVEQRVLPIDRAQAELAAELFNQTGRRRALRFDIMVAAAAISNGAELFTFNVADFKPFVPMGLKLLPA